MFNNTCNNIHKKVNSFYSFICSFNSFVSFNSTHIHNKKEWDNTFIQFIYSIPFLNTKVNCIKGEQVNCHYIFVTSAFDQQPQHETEKYGPIKCIRSFNSFKQFQSIHSICSIRSFQFINLLNTIIHSFNSIRHHSFNLFIRFIRSIHSICSITLIIIHVKYR